MNTFSRTYNPETMKAGKRCRYSSKRCFVHMKSRLEQFNPKKNVSTGVNNWKGNNYNNNANRWRRPNIPNLPDPNAMDLSPGRARLAQAEDYEPGRNRYHPRKEQDEDWLRQEDKGKSLNVSIVTSQVTLKETVDSP
jgi:hypothetical protein